MRTEIVVAIIEALPELAAVIGIVTVLVIFRKVIAERIIPRVTGVKFLGMEITLLKEELDVVTAEQLTKIMEAVHNSKDLPRISEQDKWSALRRAQWLGAVIQGARILWVDDEPKQRCVHDDRSIADPKQVNERQANAFGSELLMPEPWVREHWPRLENIQAMAAAFGVSDQAMYYRLEDLNLVGLPPRR